MDFGREQIKQGWTLIRVAPIPFAVLLAAVWGITWFLNDMRYSDRVATLEQRLNQREDAIALLRSQSEGMQEKKFVAPLPKADGEYSIWIKSADRLRSLNPSLVIENISESRVYYKVGYFSASTISQQIEFISDEETSSFIDPGETRIFGSDRRFDLSSYPSGIVSVYMDISVDYALDDKSLGVESFQIASRFSCELQNANDFLLRCALPNVSYYRVQQVDGQQQISKP